MKKRPSLDLYLSDKTAYINALVACADELDNLEPTRGELIEIETEDIIDILRDGLSVGKAGYSLDDYSEDSIYDWECYCNM
jgi:hypothetical protein